MQYKRKTPTERLVSSLRKQGNKRVCRLLAEDPDLPSFEARKIVTKEIRDKYNLKGFRL